MVLTKCILLFVIVTVMAEHPVNPYHANNYYNPGEYYNNQNYNRDPAHINNPYYNNPYNKNLAYKNGVYNPAYAGNGYNGAAYDGAAYNGAAYNGVAYNGAAYNGAAYNRAAYNPAYYSAAQGAQAIAYSNNQSPDGSYAFSFSTTDGKQAEESGFQKDVYVGQNGELEGTQVVQGSYSYTSPEGTPVQVSYIADENGFRTTGVNIPSGGKIVGPNIYPTPGVNHAVIVDGKSNEVHAKIAGQSVVPGHFNHHYNHNNRYYNEQPFAPYNNPLGYNPHHLVKKSVDSIDKSRQ